MMKKLMILLGLIAALAWLPACNHPAEKATAGKENKKKPGRYFCTMHPSISSDTPGICPKCGMELVERDTTGKK